MKLLRFLILFCAFMLVLSSSCEKDMTKQGNDLNPSYRLMFYNVENLFDTVDNPDKNDQDFLPDGRNEWTEKRYYEKLRHIARVIEDVGDEAFPVLVGLCEVENLDVLEGLVLATSLKEAGYEIVHKESPDYRGIDVALLYRPSVFKLLDYKAWQVWFPFEENYSTREVLYAMGSLPGGDTLHFIVNHWPSRSAGEIETRPKRIFVAEMLRTKVDSILQIQPDARIVITGDFNDEPDDLSLVSGLNAFTSFGDPKNRSLYNLSHFLQKNIQMGSYKYKGNWNMLDQFIISGSLLDTNAGLYSSQFDVHLFEGKYLLEKDNANMGFKPYRTYLGSFYNGGYSDHLPVYLDIRYKE